MSKKYYRQQQKSRVSNFAGSGIVIILDGVEWNG